MSSWETPAGLCDLDDVVSVLGEQGVHARLVPERAAVAPTHQPDLVAPRLGPRLLILVNPNPPGKTTRYLNLEPLLKMLSLGVKLIKD